MKIENLKVIVTGAAGAIGSFVSSKLIGIGATVIALDKDPEKLSQLSSSNKKLHVYTCDLTDYEEVSKCIHKVFLDHPDVSVLINNAGLIYSAPLINLLS